LEQLAGNVAHICATFDRLMSRTLRDSFQQPRQMLFTF
jgi:hypothetical protein